ncbi:2-oxo-4-hydroxy-4-carboxy-5-ureidoimidazoline decarboxylase [Alkalihalobacillus sp. BA299]|uniref:2-oxo-4-hydroxy-4-carboxy-5-ureidoimidazoline decarboxylase n=1 Tax=Alkalihalobacillus sp. BA299 TaxID=2815938 RepID=UPI001ADBEE60|nr:2-oxo-4-hydroxy-4-carboxy-5-ureidoimidazoline decarboxylase [Alkalihalobacillus sp. BA299]
MISMKTINKMQAKEYIKTFGSIFENSPWIAEKAWGYRPFANLSEMYNIMVTIVFDARLSSKLALLKAHPDLGTRLEISSTSQQEQLQAGLNQLSEDEYTEFSKLNKQYTEKFGFPFILAVRGKTKEVIKENMKKRVHYRYEQEIETALNEVCKIAKFRLLDIVSDRIEVK